MGVDYSTGAWRGFAGPKGMPADMAAKLTAALKKVYDSKEYNDFMASRGFGVDLGRRAGLREVHGCRRRADGQGHEGRRAREG